MQQFDSWQELQSYVKNKAKKLGNNYIKSLNDEIKEIDKQGANQYWVDLYNSNKKFQNNKNGLVIGYLLNLTFIDPIKENINHIITYQPDFPDVDIDVQPHAREPIKKYIAQKYGQEYVCEVGLWQTYKLKLAVKDCARALGNQSEAFKSDADFTRHIFKIMEALPDEIDNLSIEDAQKEYKEFAELANKYPEVVKAASGLIGRIKAQGRHAAGIIISNVPIYNYIPMSKLKGHWVSEWTEGFNPQLSKFGFVKFDLLGLRTLQDIFEATDNIKKTKNIEIDWSFIHPKHHILGLLKEPEKKPKPIFDYDKKSLDLVNSLKVESIFQFETDFAMSVIDKIGVESFNDLIACTSLGRPGPMEEIPTYIENRADKKKEWKKSLPPKMAEILEPSHCVIMTQEQLQSIWTEMCGLTVPEAEAARKAVAKKKADVLLSLGPRIVKGLSQHMSEKEAEEWWSKMTTFGRYAFNASHSLAYMCLSFRCLYLKAHYPTEWWASVLAHAAPWRKVKYMGTARAEGVKFDDIDINSLSGNFTVIGKNDDVRIVPGLTAIKKMGTKVPDHIVKNMPYNSLDDFMEKNKAVNEKTGKEQYVVTRLHMERLIKLGAFDKLHPNRRATWYYYVYKYTKNVKETLHRDIKNVLSYKFDMSEEEILKKRHQMIIDWRNSNPRNKNKTSPPKKILNWKPKARKYTKEEVESLALRDYDYEDRLTIENKFLGFYWHNPMELYNTKGNNIEAAKETGILECIIETHEIAKTKRGTDYHKLIVTDGVDRARLTIWENEAQANSDLIQPQSGIRVEVDYSEDWKSFTCKRNRIIVSLIRKEEYSEYIGKTKPKNKRLNEIEEKCLMLEEMDMAETSEKDSNAECN